MAEHTPGERAESNQAAAAAREIVDALVASSVAAYLQDPNPGSTAARARADEWLPHLRGLSEADRLLVEMEMLTRLSLQRLAHRRLTESLVRIFDEETRS